MLCSLTSKALLIGFLCRQPVLTEVDHTASIQSAVLAAEPQAQTLAEDTDAALDDRFMAAVEDDV